MPPSSPAGAGSAAGHRVAAATSAVLLIVALAAAWSVDVVKNGFGIKGDESTYIAMALSVAYDHDLSYQHRDIERFWGIYRSGPEGIFLKRGQQWHARFRGSPPYLIVSRVADSGKDRLYFGKPFIYAVAVAPLVRVFGVNGMLIFHVLLLFGVCVSGYRFLAARSRPGPALVFTLAFVGATTVPVYAVFLTSDIFNFALVFFAYFLWLYKEVAPPDGLRFLRSPSSDVAGAVLLGMATFSKPINVLLIGPIVLLYWWRRQWRPGLVAGMACAAAAAALWGVNAASSGEFNYQGGDRKTFYSYFPMDAPDATWDRLGISMATNDADTVSVLKPGEFVNRFALNVRYFMFGRHFGFVPYFFPGAVAILLWIASRDRFQPWRVLTFLALIGSTAALLIFFPYSWSGGGGPPGNRYFLNLYPVVFFLTPPLASMSPAILAWIGGALFTAKMIVNPFYAGKFTYQTAERGFARRLPVELTMGNDLPIMLNSTRARVPYGHDPTVLMYFLDERAYPPEQTTADSTHREIWVSGSGRSDILVRSDDPIDHLAMTVESPIRTVFTVSAGAAETTLPLVPGKTATFDVGASGVRGFESYAYLLSVQSSDGFTPHLVDPNSRDNRNLGVRMKFTVVSTAPPR